MVADISNAHQILAHINEAIAEREFDVIVENLSDQIGIISIQGPKRYTFTISNSLTSIEYEHSTVSF